MRASDGRPPERERGALDWARMRARLDAARVAAEVAWTPPADAARRILHERALALADEAASTQPLDQGIEVTEFLLAHERYGIECSFVREVSLLETLTPVPCTPAFVLGIVNLRGEIVSVIDMRRFFELPQSGLSDTNKIIVLESEHMMFGIVVDAVLGVRRIPRDEIQPSLPTLSGIRATYLMGITPGRTVILDAAKLLTDEGLVVHDHVPG